jgi:hypothetical protein
MRTEDEDREEGWRAEDIVPLASCLFALVVLFGALLAAAAVLVVVWRFLLRGFFE